MNDLFAKVACEVENGPAILNIDFMEICRGGGGPVNPGPRPIGPRPLRMIAYLEMIKK